jgi:hypothetical protein
MVKLSDKKFHITNTTYKKFALLMGRMVSAGM